MNPSDDAEEMMLAAMLLDPAAIEQALERLEPNGEQKFGRASNGLIYRACRRMHADGETVDVVTLAAFLARHGKLEGHGERIREIGCFVPSVRQTGAYAGIVREGWAKRQLVAALTAEAQSAANGHTSAETMEHAETVMLELRSRIEQGGKSAVATMYDLGDQLSDRVANPPDLQAGVPAPFSFLTPLLPGRLYVLAGYTADGKTVLAVQYTKAAAKRGKRVGFFSIEMTKEQLFDRMVASFGVPLGEVESGRILPPHLPAYRAALKEILTWKVDVIDDRASDAASFRRYQTLRRYDLIVIDHLHEIDVGGRAGDRRQLLEDEVRKITTVARSLDVPVLLLAQLSRAQGAQRYPRPTMAMLRETGRIEQSAWMVAFVWRKRDEASQPTAEAEFIVAKNRGGPLARVPLLFQGETVRFTEIKEAP